MISITVNMQAITKATHRSVEDPFDLSGIYLAKITVPFDILDWLFMKFPCPDLIESSNTLLLRGGPTPKGILKNLRSSLYEARSWSAYVFSIGSFIVWIYPN